MPADQRIDLAGFHGVEQRLEARPVPAVERRQVVVVIAGRHLPAELGGQGQAVLQLAGDAEAFAVGVLADADVDGAADSGHATSMSSWQSWASSTMRWSAEAMRRARARCSARPVSLSKIVR